MTTTRILPDRLAQLPTLHLDLGNHDSWEEGHCILEVTSWLAGREHNDHPPCVSPVLRTYLITLNDEWDDLQRQTLLPYAARIVGTAGDGMDEARSYLALDWLIRTLTPAWLDLAGLTVEAEELRGLRRITDMVAVDAAVPVVRNARTKAAAAWAAAGAAAGAAAWDAAWDAARAAAGAAAGAAAWDAARAAAWDAAGAAAWDAARATAGAAARAAAWDTLAPTVATLQASALTLLDQMLNPAATT